MIWKEHSKVLEGSHAYLSPSQYSWLNWDTSNADAIRTTYYHKRYSTQIGVVLHALASTVIRKGIIINKSDSKLLLLELLKNDIPEASFDIKALFPNWRAYVNDCITTGMTTEQLLYYSDVAFGTSDAIRFDKNNLLIFDYKSGVTPASPHQLEIYAALFCLEYGNMLGFGPGDINYELRIYQNNDIWIGKPTGVDIAPVMDKIVLLDKILRGEA